MSKHKGVCEECGEGSSYQSVDQLELQYTVASVNFSKAWWQLELVLYVTADFPCIGFLIVRV